MLDTKDKGRILQIIFHCERINDIIKEVSKKDFNSDLGIREMICFNIFQIGELAKGLSDNFIKEFNKQPWKQIKGMRDIIGHGYGTMDFEIVWNTAKNNIKDLHHYLESILKENE